MKCMPNHCPVWTEIGVKELGSHSMHFEIDVEAYDEEGAVEARSKSEGYRRPKEAETER